MADCIIAGGKQSLVYGAMMGYKTALNWKIAKRSSSLLPPAWDWTAEELAREYESTRELSRCIFCKVSEKALATIRSWEIQMRSYLSEVEETYVDEKGKKKTRKYICWYRWRTSPGILMEALAGITTQLSRMVVQVQQVILLKILMELPLVVGHVRANGKGIESRSQLQRMMLNSVAGVDPRNYGNRTKRCSTKKHWSRQAWLLTTIDWIELNEAFAAARDFQ